LPNYSNSNKIPLKLIVIYILYPNPPTKIIGTVNRYYKVKLLIFLYFVDRIYTLIRMNIYFLIIRGVYFLSNKIAEGLKSTKIGDDMQRAYIGKQNSRCRRGKEKWIIVNWMIYFRFKSDVRKEFWQRSVFTGSRNSTRCFRITYNNIVIEMKTSVHQTQSQVISRGK